MMSVMVLPTLSLGTALGDPFSSSNMPLSLLTRGGLTFSSTQQPQRVPSADLCSLQNENLFPPERVMFSKRKSVYAQIMPSFLLASRIILDKPQLFNVFIARRPHQGTVKEEDMIALEPDELINIIRCHMPDLDFDIAVDRQGLVRDLVRG